MLSPGTLLQGRYRIDRQIGVGGMGTVYLAYDSRLGNQPSAIKEFSPGQVPPQDRQWQAQAFQQEAQMLATLNHPGLVRVSDYFNEFGNWYLVMDFVHGQTLDDWLSQYPHGLPIDVALNYATQLCDVLEYLHGQPRPVIFRDLKPGNVMVTAQGNVKLIDFGIARFFKPGQKFNTVPLGTPGYASPEHGSSGQTDGRSDLYSLGVVLHQLVTGCDPTVSSSVPYQRPPARHLNPTVPLYLEAAIQKATEFSPAQRFQTAREFKQALLTQSLAGTSINSSSTLPTRSRFPAGSVPAMLAAIGVLLIGISALVVATRSGTPTAVPAIVSSTVTSSSAAAPQSPASTQLRPTSTHEPVAAAFQPTTPSSTLPPPAPPTATTLPTANRPQPAKAGPANTFLIPAGGFNYGANSEEIQRGVLLCNAYGDIWCKADQLSDEAENAGWVYLAEYKIDRFEVTNDQYRQCVTAGACSRPQTSGSNPRRADFDSDLYGNRPVVYVSWFNAVQYCDYVSGRLPTSQEWEKAARGATDRRIWPWGNESPDGRTNFRAINGIAANEQTDGASRVGGDAAAPGLSVSDKSPYGVMDMAGNVYEWVAGDMPNGRKELRGGSWNTGSYATRVTNRAPGDPTQGYFDVGFRCVYAP